MMSRIGVDARTYFFRAGLGRYCRNVASSLVSLAKNCRFFFWISGEKTVADFPLSSTDTVEVRICPAPFGHLESERTAFCDEINACALDAFFSPYSPVPPGAQLPSLLAVHDLTVFRFPELHLESTVQYLKAALPESLVAVSRIIASSDQTASDLGQFFPDLRLKIQVVPLGVESRYFREDGARLSTGLLERYGLKDQPYILYVGSLESRKNLLRAIEAYADSSLVSRFTFVLAGVHRWGSEELVARVAQDKLQRWVRFLDYVAEEDLPGLYRGALFFVYPSLYEGFGLPVLEAMASGVPVLSSNCSSLPEVAGDAALLVDPRNISELRFGMERLACDASLREHLAARGARRAQCYTWERTGKQILRLIDSCRRGLNRTDVSDEEKGSHHRSISMERCG